MEGAEKVHDPFTWRQEHLGDAYIEVGSVEPPGANTACFLCQGNLLRMPHTLGAFPAYQVIGDPGLLFWRVARVHRNCLVAYYGSQIVREIPK